MKKSLLFLSIFVWGMLLAACGGREASNAPVSKSLNDAVATVVATAVTPTPEPTIPPTEEPAPPPTETAVTSFIQVERQVEQIR